MLRDPPIVTRIDLKRALTTAQVAMLKYAKTFAMPPATITAGLGSMPKDNLETRRKTNKEIMDAMRKYHSKTASSLDAEVPIEIDAMVRALEDEERESSRESEDEAETEGPLFFMEHNHDQLRAQEESDAQDYWEEGITLETINALKQGNMDHSQKVCYHCSRKGHIEANCPSRKKLESKLWEHSQTRRESRRFGSRSYGARKERGKPSTNRANFAKRKHYGGAQAIHKEEDF